MRFILNFVFYGILFYLIHLAFPEAFFTMVSWADKLYEWIKELYFQLAGRVRDWDEHSSTGPSQHALFLLSSCLYYFRK